MFFAKNKNIYKLCNLIQSSIQSDAVTCKSIDTVVKADKMVNYPTEFLKSLYLPGTELHAACAVIQNRYASSHAEAENSTSQRF